MVNKGQVDGVMLDGLSGRDTGPEVMVREGSNDLKGQVKWVVGGENKGRQGKVCGALSLLLATLSLLLILVCGPQPPPPPPPPVCCVVPAVLFRSCQL